ncbi:leucine-rich repeat-containing G-protein coupled receptor 4-like [Aphidius gifuensis]|uniref:leucine-rich repeat-containing G-protein coupled receptor 4-like n=1 Tax=Aphidius gifuensis TaxID=684658 RepID=UPI001CDC18BB|nr:leucine-rich repeat-containing G-protein coupled receptor 4-like [Aphidius gifuensis]
MAWTLDVSTIQTDCFDDELLRICQKVNTLTSVNLLTNRNDFTASHYGTWSFISTDREKIELSKLHTISSIGRNAFMDLEVRTFLKTLIIHKTNNVFMIYPESFVGLTQLENLELDVGPILLQAHLFDSLPSLKFLKIEVIETFQYLSQVLAPLSNLKTIEILGNRSVGICQNKFSYEIPHLLTDIRYTNGPLKELQANSMTCIAQLEKFTITNTQLSTIQAGAFKSMDNLKYVNLAYNQITMIYEDTFDGLSCNFFHLSHNKIQRIESNAFKHSDIQNLYVLNITFNVEFNKKFWSLPDSTHVYSSANEDEHYGVYIKPPMSKWS